MVTAVGASIVYAYTGIIQVKDIFAGYNNNTIILLAVMMVVGASLFHAGITELIGQKMVQVTGKNERNIVFVTMVVACLLSSVCSNIGVMTAMAPLVAAMCVAAVIGMLVILGIHCMTVQDAIKAIDWNCLILVGSLTAIASGLRNSGLGNVMAD